MLIAAVRQGEQWPLFPCLRTHRSGNTCPSRTQTQGTGYHTGEYQQQKSGLCFNVKTVFLGTGISIIKLRQSYDSYFILGVSYTGYRDLTIFSYWEIIYRYWDSHFFCPYLYFVNSYICWDLRYVDLCKFLTKWALVVQQSMIEVCWGLKFCILTRPTVNIAVNKIDIERVKYHLFASQLSGHCDVIANRLWHHQQNVKRASETWGWHAKILVFSIIYRFVMSCKK